MLFRLRGGVLPWFAVADHHGIAGAFRDHGIEIAPHQVQALIDTYESLTSKSLPKAAAKAQIAATGLAFRAAPT